MSPIRQIIILLFTFASLYLGGCGSDPILTTASGQTLTQLRIKENGATIKSRPEMAHICNGFLLTKKSFVNFFRDAAYIKKFSPSNDYGILPCYAAGTVIINGSVYNWVIHSGGIGEFISHDKKFLMVCGKDCCDKIAGMC